MDRLIELAKSGLTQAKIAKILNKENVPHYKGFDREWSDKDVSAACIANGLRRVSRVTTKAKINIETNSGLLGLVEDLVTSNLSSHTKERMLRMLIK